MKEHIVPEHLVKTACPGKIWFLSQGSKWVRLARFLYKKSIILENKQFSMNFEKKGKVEIEKKDKVKIEKKVQGKNRKKKYKVKIFK